MSSRPLRHTSLLILLLTGCRACDPAEDSPEPDDTAPTDDSGPTDGPIIVVVEPAPSLTITSPTTANRYEAEDSALSLTGTASDEVVEVRWEILDGDAGVASGTTSWSAELNLEEGLNQIRVQGSTAEGDTASAFLRVLWQPDVSFDARPSLDSFIYRPGDSAQFTVGVLAEGELSAAEGVMDCLETGEQAFTVSEAGRQGEHRLYEGEVAVPEATDQCDLWLTIEVDGEARRSQAAALWVREEPSAERIDELSDLQLDLASIAGETPDDWDAIWAAVRPELEARSDIDKVFYTGDGVFWLTDDPLWYSLGGVPILPASEIEPPIAPPGLRPSSPPPPAPPADGGCGQSADPIPKALYIYTTDEDFPHFKAPYPGDELQGWAAQGDCIQDEDIHLAGLAAAEPDIADYLASLEAGLIFIEGHGGNMPVGWMPTTWPPPTGIPYWYPFGSSKGAIQLQLRNLEWCTLNPDGTHSQACKDIYEPYQLRWGELIDVSVQPHDATKGVLRILGVGGVFDSEIPANSLDDSVVMLSNCNSMSNNSMHSVFTDKGAATVLGYSSATIMHFTALFENGLYGYLLPGYAGASFVSEGGATILEAYDQAYDDIGYGDDKAWGAAQPDPDIKAVAKAMSGDPSWPEIEGYDAMHFACCPLLQAALGAGNAELILSGVAGYNGFGSHMAAAGDVDGDDVPDVVVGHAGAYGTGAAWLYSGYELQLLEGNVSTDSGAMAVLQGATGDQYGYRVAGVGDTNMDGWDDLLVGAPGASSTAGAAYLYTGPITSTSPAPSAVIYGAEAGDAAGFSLGAALLPHERSGSADVNGDGYEDILLGAYKATPGDPVLNDSGAAYLFHGPLTGTWTTDQAWASFQGQRYLGYAGFNVGMLGDTNGDGFAEVGVNSALYNGGAESASIYVFQGPVAAGAHALETGSADGNMGGNRAPSDLLPGSAGDVNGDGYNDVFVGNGSDGEVYIVHGGSPMAWPGSLAGGADVVLMESSSSAAGDHVAAAGDLNCDGFDDLLVGAPYSNGGANYAGAAYLVMGPLEGGTYSLANADSAAYGSAMGQYMGAAVAGVGDISGGGCADIAISASYDNGGYVMFFYPESGL